MNERKEVPLFPLNAVLFPGMTLPLRVFEPRYLQMIDECLKKEPYFGVVLIKEGPEVGEAALPHEIGTLARIVSVRKRAPDLLHVTAVGDERFYLHRVSHDKPYLVGEVEPFPLQEKEAPEVGLLVDVGVELLSVYLDLLSQVSEVQIQLQRTLDTSEALAHFIAMLLQVPLPVKQRLLSIADLPTLLREEAVLLRGDVSALTVMLRGREVLARYTAPPDFSWN